MIGRAAALVAWAGALAIAGGGCATKINQAAFGVASDLPAAMLDGLTIVVSSSGGAPMQTSVPLGGSAMTFLPSLLEVYSTGSVLPQVDVAVAGTSAGVAVVRRRVRTILQPEQTRFVRLALVERCIGVACGADQTCIEGACAGVDVDLTRALPYVTGQEYGEACGDPMFRFSADDSPVPPPDGGCAPGQPCVEGTCYQPAGAPPVPGAGEFAAGTLGDFVAH